MRVLFVSTPGIGHVFPMVPLAWTLRAAGHDVLVATAGPALAVERAGLAVADIAAGLDLRRAKLSLFRSRPELAERARTLRGRKLGDLREAVDYLGPMSALLVDGAVEIAAAWRPDLLVQSQVDAAALVVAGRFDVPLVTHGFGLARTGGLAELYHDRLRDAFERHGVAAAPLPAAAIDVAPPSMLSTAPDTADADTIGIGNRADAAVAWPMRYVPYNGGGRLPSWLLRPPSRRPRIAVTLGTVEPRRGGLGGVHQIIAAAETLDVELVLALGEISDAAVLGDVPPHVRLAGWLPLNVLLRSCSAIIHHGGAGSTLTALDGGVPQLVLPSGADRYINAAAVQERGVGLRSDDGVVTTAMLDRLINDGPLRAAAAEVRTEMAEMPLPASLLPRLTALTR